MEVLYPKYPGRIAICSYCGALLGNIKENDIYDGDIYCPICKQKTHIEYDKNYNGEIKNDSSESDNG